MKVKKNQLICLFLANNIDDCARESMKFEMRKYHFELKSEYMQIEKHLK
jgi:hypothetical protein